MQFKSLLKRGLLAYSSRVRTNAALPRNAKVQDVAKGVVSPRGVHNKRRAEKKASQDKEYKIAFQQTDRQEEALAVLHPGKSRLFYDGSPIVYKGNIAKIIAASPPASGDPVTLVDHNLSVIGWGVYNSESMYTLRLLEWAGEMQKEADRASIGAVLTQRIQQAKQNRSELNFVPASKQAYRLVNSEGDRLSGLVVDMYGDTAVVSSSAAWIQQFRQVIESSLKGPDGTQQVIWRPAVALLQLEGHNVAEQHAQDNLEAVDTDKTTGRSQTLASPNFVVVEEHGVQYKVDLQYGQKTGFYADQRESRALIQALARDRSVLDLCCYTGGFALASASGGASQVTGVDSSKSAISLAKENAELNQLDHVDFVQTDIESFTRDAARDRKQWDVVVLDPPKLAPKKSAIPRASRKYVSLNAAALKLVAPGGLFVTCSCSGAVAQGEGLLPYVKEAAKIAGRRLALIRSAGAAMDHPLDPSFPEGQYLTNLLFRVQ